MADRGAIGHTSSVPRGDFPRDSSRRGSLDLTGTARVNEIAHRTTLTLFSVRSMFPLISIQSAADGAFAFRNLAAGRYIVIVHGQQDYLPGTFAVDVS